MTEPPISEPTAPQAVIAPPAATEATPQVATQVAVPQDGPPRRGRGVWVAAAAVVLLLLAGGGLGAYFLKYRSDSDAALADQQAQITTLEGQVAAHQETIDNRDERLREAQGVADAAKKRVANLDQCPAAVQALVDSIKNTNSLPTNLVLVMVDRCGVTL